MAFEKFVAVAPISEKTISAYAGQVPEPVAHAWRDHGAGFVGDGYFRFIDPARGAAMLGEHSPLPPEAVILFTTALADVVAWWNGMFLVAKTRLGEIHATSVPFERLVTLLEDVPGQRDAVWDWQPYPTAVARLGVPGFEECFMHVPLLGMGGRGEPERMETGSLWLHIGIMVQFTGKPRFTHMLALPGGE